MTSSSTFLAGAKALALLGARAAGIMPAMTLVEITYELQSPLSDEQLRSLGSFANTYGLRRFIVEDNSQNSSHAENACDGAEVAVPRAKKWGPCLGTRAPVARSIVIVVFPPTRGVIHPSFPLRGRWERILKSGEQAPSPSLATPLDSSLERAQADSNARLAPTMMCWCRPGSTVDSGF